MSAILNMLIGNHASASATPKAPDEITGLDAWYKTPISGATNNVAITSWPDDANAYDLTSAVDPIYKTSVLNGYDVLDFTASSSQRLNVGGAPSNVYPRTMFMVVKRNSAATAHTMLFGSTNTTALAWYIVDTDGRQQLDSQNAAGIGGSATPLADDTWYVLAVRVTSTAFTFFVNGVADGTGSHSRVLSGSARSFTIGINSSASNTYMYGQIAECGTYTTAVSDEDIAALSAHLLAKYAL